MLRTSRPGQSVWECVQSRSLEHLSSLFLQLWSNKQRRCLCRVLDRLLPREARRRMGVCTQHFLFVTVWEICLRAVRPFFHAHADWHACYCRATQETRMRPAKSVSEVQQCVQERLASPVSGAMKFRKALHDIICRLSTMTTLAERLPVQHAPMSWPQSLATHYSKGQWP